MKYHKLLLLVMTYTGSLSAGEFALSLNFLTSEGGKIGYYSKGENKGFYHGGAISVDFKEINPKYVNIYTRLDTFDMIINAYEYGFGWELGYQMRVNKKTRLRFAAIASAYMLDGTDPDYIPSTEQLSYAQYSYKLAPVAIFSNFPIQTTEKDRLGLTVGFELPVLITAMGKTFPGIDRIQYKLFAGLCY